MLGVLVEKMQGVCRGMEWKEEDDCLKAEKDYLIANRSKRCQDESFWSILVLTLALDYTIVLTGW